MCTSTTLICEGRRATYRTERSQFLLGSQGSNKLSGPSLEATSFMCWVSLTAPYRFLVWWEFGESYTFFPLFSLKQQQQQQTKGPADQADGNCLPIPVQMPFCGVTDQDNGSATMWVKAGVYTRHLDLHTAWCLCIHGLGILPGSQRCGLTTARGRAMRRPLQSTWQPCLWALQCSLTNPQVWKKQAVFASYKEGGLFYSCSGWNSTHC